MDQIKFNIDTTKLYQELMGTELMFYVRENKQTVLLTSLWLLSTLITFLIQTSYVSQNRTLKGEIELHLESIENITNEYQELQSENIELEKKNTELNTDLEKLQKEVSQLNLKISKLKEKNVVLCESLEEFLSLRLKKRRLTGKDEWSNEESHSHETHQYNLRSLKTEDDEDAPTHNYNLRQTQAIDYTEN
jgi:hypothetical protein